MLNRLIFTTITVLLYHCVSHADTVIPAPPQLAASAYILIDANSGFVIAENNADNPLPPASLTKMMTAYLVAEELAENRLALTDQVPVSVKAWRTGGSKMFIREGTTVSLDDLLKGVIIQSGNDASIAIAEYLAGSEGAFVDRMNAAAKRLGLNNTQYANATGFPTNNHYTTAQDLARLAQAVIFDYPTHYDLYAEKSFKYNNISQRNRNSLLWSDPSVDGIKTGHTEEAGYCLVSSAKRDSMRLISVVLGTQSKKARAQESQKLLAYGFRYYDTRTLYKNDDVLAQAPIYKGTQETVNLGLRQPLILTIPRGRQDDIKAKIDFPKVIEAPIVLQQTIGTITLTLDQEVLFENELVALTPVEKGSIWVQLWDSIRILFDSLFASI